jgi:hypothetical protein
LDSLLGHAWSLEESEDEEEGHDITDIPLSEYVQTVNAACVCAVLCWRCPSAVPFCCRLWQAWTQPLHPIVVQLQMALDRNLISADHMLLQLLRCGLDQALRPKSGVFAFPPAIKTWAESLEFYGGDFVMKLLRGARKEGKCKQPGTDKTAFSFDFATLPLPSRATLLKGKPGYIPVSGVSPQILGSFIDLLNEPARSVPPLVSNATVSVYAVALCRDGMAIKPGLQFDQTTKCVVGLEDPEMIAIEYVRQNPQPSPSLLRNSLVVEAHEAVLTPLTGEFSMPAATLYRGKGKTSASVFAETIDLLSRVTTCKRCCRLPRTSNSACSRASLNAAPLRVTLARMARRFASHARFLATKMCQLRFGRVISALQRSLLAAV